MNLSVGLTDVVCWVVVKCTVKSEISKISHNLVCWAEVSNLHTHDQSKLRDIVHYKHQTTFPFAKSNRSSNI